MSSRSAHPRFFRDSAFGLTDQAILSLGNFAVGIFLIQSTGKDEYGIYVLAFAAVLLLIGVQNALVSTQMTVLAPGQPGDSRDRFCGALASGQYLLFIPMAVVCGVMVLVAHAAGWLSDTHLSLFIAVTIATLGTLLREFMRSLLFLRLQPGLVLAVDAVYLLWLFVTLYLASKLDPGALHIWAILALGGSSLVAGLIALRFARLPLRQTLTEQGKALGMAWKGGRWALAGVTVTWIQDQSYVYLLSALAGSAGAAEANAARMLLMPVMLLNVGITRVTMPGWAALRYEGKRDSVEASARRILAVLLLVVSVYVAMLYLGRNHVIPLLFTADYQSIGSLILLWGVIIALQMARSSFSNLLQVYQSFRQITLANTVSAVAVLASAIVLIPSEGIRGSLMALVIGEVILTILLAALWRRTA